MDSHGRVLRDLRVSVTDRCNFRCLYCLPETEEAANFYQDRLASASSLPRASPATGSPNRKSSPSRKLNASSPWPPDWGLTRSA